MRLIGFGEILWDIFQDRECLGGAPLNFSIDALRLGHQVRLISAVGWDDRGRRALDLLRKFCLPTQFIQEIPDQPTGVVTVTVDSGGQPSYAIHRPAAYDFVTLDDTDLQELAAFQPDWICHGTLHSMAGGAAQLLRSLFRRFPRARRFYDVNLRENSFTTALVAEFLESAQIVKLNDLEADAIQAMFGTKLNSLEAFCRDYAARFGWDCVCVTRGEKGCALLLRGQYEEVAGYPTRVADTVGAGDAFAAALLHGVDAGWPAWRAGDFANRLGALVAGRPGGVPDWSPEEIAKMTRSG